MSIAMLALGLLVLHAHLGFEAQARERRAQVVRDAGEHHGAVLLDLGELARHPVEAHVDLADLAGHRRLVEARVVLAFADAAGGERQLLERPVDQAGDRRPSRARWRAARSPTHSDDRAASTSGRRASGRPAASRGRARSRSRPTGPARRSSQLATMVSGPSWSRSSRSMTRWKRSTSNGSHLSLGSRGVACTDFERRDALDQRDAVDAVGAEQRGAARG